MPWINAKDKVPDQDKLVLVYYDSAYYLATLFKVEKTIHFQTIDDLFGVTDRDLYWRYLPKKPVAVNGDSTDGDAMTIRHRREC